MNRIFKKSLITKTLININSIRLNGQVIIREDLRDQILKREIKCGYYIKTLKVDN